MPLAFNRYKTTFLVLFFTLLISSSCWGQASEEVLYKIDASALKNHRLKINARFPPAAFPTSERELALPVWTPGSYKVRDYSRFVDQVKVLNPGARITKTSKNRWLVQGVEPDQAVLIEYTVYGHELTVRTNHFTEELALVTGAATFLTASPLKSQEMNTLDYVVDLSATGLESSCALELRRPGVYVAPNYDELVDSPIVLGDISAHPFMVGGKEHQLVQAGDYRYWDLKKSLDDTARLVETIQEFWGQIVPYDHYYFLNLITNSRGGLEHSDSTVVMTSRFATQDRKAYLGWLSIMSHEYFHTWNVKRLRPKSLGPFDYEKEVYTRSLWIAEGITSYYDDLLVRRAGLSTREEYLEALSVQLNRLQTTPGRLNIDLSDASFDTWIRLYQPTDDLHNSNISYYNKGSIVAWLLDTEIRQRSKGKRSLDDVMRAAYSKFSDDGFTEVEFRKLASKVAGSDLSDFYALTLDSTAELPLARALDYWALKWEPDSKKPKAYLGLETDPKKPGLVKKVFSQSPAAKAGVAPGDELLALDNIRLAEADSLDIVDHLTIGQSYPLLFSRLGRVRSTKVTLASHPHQRRKLALKKSTPEHEGRWLIWLGPERKSSP